MYFTGRRGVVLPKNNFVSRPKAGGLGLHPALSHLKDVLYCFCVSIKSVCGRFTGNKDKRGMTVNLIKYSKTVFGIIYSNMTPSFGFQFWLLLWKPA